MRGNSDYHPVRCALVPGDAPRVLSGRKPLRRNSELIKRHPVCWGRRDRCGVTEQPIDLVVKDKNRAGKAQNKKERRHHESGPAVALERSSKPMRCALRLARLHAEFSLP